MEIRNGDLIQVTPTVAYTKDTLSILVLSLEELMFFAKLYDLSGADTVRLAYVLFPHLKAVGELLHSTHSEELQSYTIDQAEEFFIQLEPKESKEAPIERQESFLTELFKAAEIQIASSIKEIAGTLSTAVSRMPGKQGRMVLKQLNDFNRQRSSIGSYKAVIEHPTSAANLVILDVSGSMTPQTISRIITEVVDLAWHANAHLAIVSNSAFLWEPGTYSEADVMRAAEFQGTHYEQLLELTNLNWGHVITIADYDSSPEVKKLFQDKSTGHIDKVIDISLVNRPTHLSECLSVIADTVQHALITNTIYPMK